MRPASRALTLVLLLAAALPARAAPALFTTTLRQVADEKAVFATVESRKIAPARTRIGGTVTALAVRDGDFVHAGQVLATIHDAKLALQIQALDAEIAGLRSQLAQANTDLGRAEALARSGAVARAQLDRARTAVRVAQSTLNARIASRAVTERELAEGAVLAPIDGRVLSVPVTDGTVVQPGETIASVAEQHFVLRLRVPERHALHLKVGDRIRFDGTALGVKGPVFGRISLVYPRIVDGAVRADATAAGVGSYFVGERVRVWVPAGHRPAIVVPRGFVFSRFGQDYVRLRTKSGHLIDVPVQRGLSLPTPAMPDGVQILAGLAPGETLVHP